MSCSDKLNEVLNKIYIPNGDCIKGNITLLDKIDDAVIEWKSSRPEIITDKDSGKLRAGVVTRGGKDEKVLLEASVSMGTEKATKALEVTVKKAPAKINDEDYVGYLFGHFIGEEAENEEQIYFAVSESGFNFKDKNNLQPVLVSNVGEKGVRDPYICRSAEGDRYFLIATDLSIYHRGGWFINEQGYYDPSTTGSQYLVLWESDDLVNWSEAKLLDVAPKNAGMAWAPEMIYNEETGEYIIFFSSSIMNPETKYKEKPNTIYYVATRDFVHFSDTKIFIDNQTDGEEGDRRREIIDTTVIKIGGWYYSVSKDGDNAEAGGGIRILKTKSLLDPGSWEKVLDMDELNISLEGRGITALDNSMLEGPEIFQLNQCDWADKNIPEYGIIADQYAVSGGYLPVVTTDLEDKDNSKKSWKLLSSEDYSFDKLKKRHGTIMRITREELERINKAF